MGILDLLKLAEFKGREGVMAITGIHSENLNAWFKENIQGAEPPLEFDLIAGGHSNLTFRVTDRAKHRFVLRRPPTGAVIATAHDMAREHRIISALAETAVPVPPALGLCEDPTVNDAPFYVMDFVDGYVLTDAATTAEVFPLERRRALGAEVVGVLATLHRVDAVEVGLGELGRTEAYLARQLKRWRTQWEKTQTRELEAMEDVYQGLLSNMPEQVGSAIVHGDYRLGNMLVNSDGGVAAILDWELCTLGDPLADLGYVINNWGQPGEEVRGGATSFPTTTGGFQTREEFVALYEELTGRNAEKIGYYRAFQYWRMAAIVEGVLSRYLKGVMGNEANTDAFRLQVDGLADSARALVAEF
jgi:aminoglycoside phosphotransferase (APT) family kinase protein